MLDEYEIRQWFKTVDLAQAVDTHRVCEGIIEMRREQQPKRARRKDAGKPRDPKESLPLMGNVVNLGGIE